MYKFEKRLCEQLYLQLREPNSLSLSLSRSHQHVVQIYIF